MGIVKVLKRKDAASVIVAVVIGMVLLQLVTQLTAKLAGQVTGLEEGQYYAAPDATWKVQYLFPVVTAALQLIALEVTIWVYVFLSGLVGKK